MTITEITKLELTTSELFFPTYEKIAAIKNRTYDIKFRDDIKKNLINLIRSFK